MYIHIPINVQTYLYVCKLTYIIHSYVHFCVHTNTYIYMHIIHINSYVHEQIYIKIQEHLNTNTHIYTTHKFIFISACMYTYMSKFACL